MTALFVSPGRNRSAMRRPSVVFGALYYAGTAKRCVLFRATGTANSGPLCEVGPNGRLIPIDDEPRSRVRFVRLTEQEAPAVRARANSKLPY
jgi:hypothetical protein